MQFKLHFSYIHRQILKGYSGCDLLNSTVKKKNVSIIYFVLEWSEVACPRMGVAVLFSLFPKVTCHVAIHNGFGQNYSL